LPGLSDEKEHLDKAGLELAEKRRIMIAERDFSGVGQLPAVSGVSQLYQQDAAAASPRRWLILATE